MSKSLYSSVAEHWSRKPGVVSSSLIGGIIFLLKKQRGANYGDSFVLNPSFVFFIDLRLLLSPGWQRDHRQVSSRSECRWRRHFNLVAITANLKRSQIQQSHSLHRFGSGNFDGKSYMSWLYLIFAFLTLFDSHNPNGVHWHLLGVVPLIITPI